MLLFLTLLTFTSWPQSQATSGVERRKLTSLQSKRWGFVFYNGEAMVDFSSVSAPKGHSCGLWEPLYQHWQPHSGLCETLRWTEFIVSCRVSPRQNVHMQCTVNDLLLIFNPSQRLAPWIKAIFSPAVTSCWQRHDNFSWAFDNCMVCRNVPYLAVAAFFWSTGPFTGCPYRIHTVFHTGSCHNPKFK